MLSHTGGLVCPGLPGGGLTGVTLRIDSGGGESPMAKKEKNVRLLSWKDGAIFLVTWKFHSSARVSIQIVFEKTNQILISNINKHK